MDIKLPPIYQPKSIYIYSEQWKACSMRRMSSKTVLQSMKEKHEAVEPLSSTQLI